MFFSPVRNAFLRRSTAVSAALVFFISYWSVAPAQAPNDGGGVHGSVFTPVVRDRVGLKVGDLQAGLGSRIYVPQFTVFLAKQPGNTKVASTTTNLFGRYHFRHQPAGEYKVCWDAPGWIPGCSPKSYQLQNDIAYVPAIAVEPVIQAPGVNTHGALWGQVKLADQSSPYFYDEYFGITRTADISVTDLSGKVLAKTVSNAWGLYVVADVPTSQVHAAATIDTTHSAVIAAAATIGTGARTDFVIPNKRPLVLSVAAKSAGAGVREAAPGAQLDVAAQLKDPDGDPLTYTWKPGPGSGQIVSSSGGTAAWKLANASGVQTLYFVATDNKGGWISRSVSITAGGGDVFFSGKAVTKTGAPIPKPTVSINGKRFSGAINGAFSAQVPRSTRYVVNVSAPGFVPASKVFDQSGLYAVYTLTRTSVLLIDPTAGSRVVATRGDKPAGNDIMRAATIILPPGSLVDAEGKAPSGLIQAHATPLNIAAGEMPGDFGARSGATEGNRPGDHAGPSLAPESAGQDCAVGLQHRDRLLGRPQVDRHLRCRQSTIRRHSVAFLDDQHRPFEDNRGLRPDSARQCKPQPAQGPHLLRQRPDALCPDTRIPARRRAQCRLSSAGERQRPDHHSGRHQQQCDRHGPAA
jgi:hypothetical protein